MIDPTSLETVLDRIATGNQTDDDLIALRQFIRDSAKQNAVQIGKYNIVIGDGKDIRIGDVQGPSAEAIQNAIRAVLHETVLEIPPPPKPTTPPVVAGFVGRESELIYFAEKLRTTHLAVIAGIAGVGKTTLAAVLASQAFTPEKIFWHTFHEGEGVDALIWEMAGFLAWHGQDDLWRMLHSTRQTGGQSRPPEVMFNYLVQMLRGCDYLLCFDDLHLVEQDPLLGKLLNQLRSALLAGELSFIATSRRMPGFVRAVEFEELKGLSIAATRDLIAKRGLALSDDLVNDLYAVTEGNAQFLMLAMDVLERATDPARVVANLSSADNIENYLLNQIDEGLATHERAVMSAVALLLGYPGTRDALEAILDESGIQRTLSNLKNRFLLNASDSEEKREYWQHATVQAFYYHLLGARERQEMHRRAGKYYETQERDFLKAARHFLWSGMNEHAAQLLTENVWGIINLSQARGLRMVLEEFKSAHLGTILWKKVNLAKGQVYTFVGEVKLARDAYQEAYSKLDGLPSSSEVNELHVHVCLGMGDLLKNSSPQEALEWLNRGLASAEVSTLDRANLIVKLGAVLARMGKFAEALSALEQGLALLPNEPNQLRAGAYINLGMVYGSQGKTEQAINAMQNGLKISEQIHDYFQILILQSNLGIAKMFAGDWRGAAYDFQESLVLSDRLDNIGERTRIENHLGMLATFQGNFEQAATHLTQSLELSRKHNLKAWGLHAMTSLVALQIGQKQWQVAAATLSEAEDLASEINARNEFPEIYYDWAQVHLVKGSHATALEWAEKSVNLARELKMNIEEAKGLRVLGQVLLANGQHQQAVEAFEKSILLLSEKDPYETARTKTQLGISLITTTPSPRGITLLQEALSTFQSLGAMHDLEMVERVLESKN